MVIKRMVAPKEVKVALNALEEIGLDVNYNDAYNIVKPIIEKAYLKDFNVVLSQVKAGVSPHVQTCFSVANLCGDLLESGKYHMYRGVINPLGPGNELLQLYNHALDKLIQLGAITKTDAESNSHQLKQNIKTVG